ncbi:unnamed protein product, partial [Orchesella dallaii]
SNLIMASVAGPSKPKAAARKKKNGFYVFMEERKLAMEESLGSKLTMSNLSLVLSEDWTVTQHNIVFCSMVCSHMPERMIIAFRFIFCFRTCQRRRRRATHQRPKRTMRR